ncbi:hypothetical protein BDW69DRAFT_200093 [Aspergillus filifer]
MGSVQQNSSFHCDAIIVGAGFSGLYGLHKLSQSGPEVWKDFQFAERFSSSEEIRRYLAHFNARVNSTIWDEATSRWTVTTEAGHVGAAKYLCLFTGLLHRQHLPEFPGLEKKRVAVIGAGTARVQIVQELSKNAGSLSMFMRRPSLCLPMGNGPMTPMEQDKMKPHYGGLNPTSNGFPLIAPKKRIFDLSGAERNEYYEMLWKSSAFHFALSNFTEVLLDDKASRTAYDFWAQKTRARFKDPVKRDLMAPVEPPYAISTRRSPLEADFYECLEQDNLEILPLLQTPFESFTENGIKTVDAEHREFDYVVFATGFESFTRSVAAMNIKSRDGVDLKDIWSEGIRTYLGMLVSEFLNCFLTPAALSNGPTILECQVDFIVDAVAKMENEGQVESSNRSAAKHTLFANADSWWTGANIPGKKKELVT